MPFDTRPVPEPGHDELPQRIQLRRIKGWKIPPNTVSVARPTKWGNPYLWAYRPPMLPPNLPWGRQEAVDAYELMLAGGWRLRRPPGFQLVEEAMKELEGKDLACWCRLDQACHASVLLRYANAVVLPTGELADV